MPKRSVKKAPKGSATCCKPLKEDIHHYSVKDMERVMESTVPCQHCAHFPIGATDLLHLLLVLIFTLSAVLMTSVYALNLEQAKVIDLQAEIQESL
ncbi:MAG: hypothetical protein WC730_01440 [Patescibacteria group bacterium]|jgi:hypothetical protein